MSSSTYEYYVSGCNGCSNQYYDLDDSNIKCQSDKCIAYDIRTPHDKAQYHKYVNNGVPRLVRHFPQAPHYKISYR